VTTCYASKSSAKHSRLQHEAPSISSSEWQQQEERQSSYGAYDASECTPPRQMARISKKKSRGGIEDASRLGEIVWIAKIAHLALKHLRLKEMFV
jgi:hypothetical protein